MQMKNNEFTNLSRKSLVVKGNPLIQAYFDDLSTIEYKLIISAMSRITPYDNVLDFINFSVKEFCELLKVQQIGMYSYLKESCNKLLKRIITIETSKNNWEKFNWLNHIKYVHGEISIKFNPALENYLLYCVENKSYTKYLLENIIDMERKYSIRVYELNKQYEPIGYRIFDLDELKALLGIPKNKYEKFGQLKRRVLNPSMEEVNGLTDININIEEIKVGRKIGQLKYFIQKKHFDIHTSNYELLPKLKIANLIQKKIHDQTGIIVDLNIIKNYHRFVLIKLLDKFDVGTFNKVIIKSPKAFFQWHLDDIKNNYDLSSIEDF